MCLCPVTIKNPKIAAGTFLVSVDKESIVVPCGHCSECIAGKRKDLIFRGYHQYLATIGHGWSMFDTLTFSEENVPMYGGFRYFDKTIVQLFLKRLKSKLDYDGYDVYGNLHWIITSEFGSHTFRPHLHVAWFSTIPGLSAQKFNEYVRNAWKNVQTKESTGFNDYKAVDRRIINSIHGIEYICKYILKSSNVVDALTYHNASDVSQFIFNSGIDLSDFSQLRGAFLSYAYNNNLPKYYTIFPFVMTSQGLGLCFLDNVSIEDLLNDVYLDTKSKKGQQKVFNVPSYYIRKVFYNYNSDSKRYVPNELFTLLDEKRKNDCINNLKESFFTIDDVFKILDANTKNRISARYDISDTVSFRNVVTRLLNGRDLSHFIKYVVYFRNVHISPYHAWLYVDCLSTLDDSFIELYTQYRNDAMIADTLPFRMFEYNYPHPEVQIPYSSISKVLFNQMPQFVDYDKLYNIIQDIMINYKIAKDKVYQLQEYDESFARMEKSDLSETIVY